MDWLDRITGELHAAPFAPFAPGQWKYCGERRITIRDAEARSGDLLLPAPDGRCQAPSLGTVRCDPHYSPDDDALHSLRLVGDRLHTLETKPWLDWAAETPLLPALADALDEAPLERKIMSRLGYLEAACERPRTHLRLEEERLAVARCKRPSARAPSDLAARSEDWERRTLWGVLPRRVLGIVREDLFDIYENRVVVALVDNLDVALLRRLCAVRRVVQLVRQRENYQQVLEDSRNYRRANRILKLWGEAIEHKGQLAHAEAVLRRLVVLRRRVLALKDTLLYRQIGGLHPARLQLRMTNVLSHDDIYRRIAELWIAWEKHIRSLSIDPEVRWRQEQDAASGFERFVFLLVIRALDALGFVPMGTAREAPLGVEGEWALDGPGGSIILRRDTYGVSLHSAHAEEPLRFLSLPAMLEAGVTISEWIQTIQKSKSLVVVALTPDEPRAPIEARVRLRSLRNTGEDAGPMFVSVAPWDLESVERIARALRWYVWSALYARYPFAMGLPSGWVPPISIPRWIRVTNGTMQVIQPPTTSEVIWKDLADSATVVASSVADARAELDACDRREKGKLRRLKTKWEEAVSDHEAVQQVEVSLRQAATFVGLLCVCPVCRTAVDTHAFEQTDDLFRCRCRECDAVWGRRSCGSCGRPFPFLDFPGNEPSKDLLNVDRRYGADVLALSLEQQVFLCPHCGRRSDGAGEIEANETA